MAVNMLPILLLLLAASAAAVAPSADELALRNAMRNLAVKAFTLQRDVYLTGDLPLLPDRKTFSLTGKKNGGSGPVIISGSGKYKMFRNSPNAAVTLTLENLILTGVRKAWNGTEEEAVVNLGVLGTRLTINNVVFTNNDRALYLDLVTATIQSSKFFLHSNSAVYLTSQEGEKDSVTFHNCDFRRNRGGEESGGGAIYATLYATVVIHSTVFLNNSASYNGGAVRFRNAYGTIRNCFFIGNWAKESGGALSVYNGALYISFTKFKGNGARIGPGGALRVSSDGDVGGYASLSRCAFEDNKTPAYQGGAFVLDTYSELIICRSTFKGNTGRRGVASNGYIIGPSNFITTTPKATIPAVSLEMDAQLMYKSGQKCRVRA